MATAPYRQPQVGRLDTHEMQIQVHGHQIDVGDALRSHVIERLTERIEKYFDRTVRGQVTFSRDGRDFRAECVVHLSSGMKLAASGRKDEIYAAFEQAVERIEKQLRRYKRRLKDHHERNNVSPLESVPAFVIAPEPEDEPEPADLQPIIVAETTAEIRTLTVGEAVMQMDLADAPVLIFRNKAHTGLNVVYRRDDGNIGWVDPQETAKDKRS